MKVTGGGGGGGGARGYVVGGVGGVCGRGVWKGVHGVW